MVRDGPAGRVEEAVSGGARQVPRARYLPIAEHGLIGDMHTVALVGTNGTIDWYCCPRFDSPSVFGAVLDADRGGAFRIAPDCDGWTSKQLYLPDTTILITRFLMPGGVGEVQDFMPPPRTGEAAHRHRMIRRVLAVRGQMGFVVDLVPRFDYARARHEVELTPHGALFRSPELQLGLSTRHPLQIVGDRDIRGRVALRAGETATFVLDRVQPGERQVPYADADIAAEFDATVAFWRRWLRGSRYSGRWRETVHRSALTLKLLTYAPTGAIVAAPTTSLPEELGGARNWDYRYTWMRDAAFSLYALLRLGFTEEAGAFMEWLEQRFRHAADCGEAGPLQIMYGIDGRAELPEEELSHLEGYMGSAPVRIGNRAATQLQLDIYGELMDSVYLCNKYGRPLYHDGWMELTRNLEWLMDHWDQPDEGIWETRTGRRDYTYSRLMSWVAVERAVRMARQRGLPADLPRWMAVRDTIYNQIMKRGWNPARQAFVQHYDTDVLDASLLIMPLCKFVAPTDPRWISTLDAITAELVSDSLVYRYNAEASPDGLVGTEATFSMCSFWWVEALARAGRLDEARLAFEKMLTYANHVGLYSEEIGPTGEQLGNFPQAFTHLALISAAYNLDRQIG
ncbi:glycoside hydrolase family 15 protein [Streptomyces sp. ME18-1-4]|uniref:glycoside hydrolase family 15 protein n=1 Tax=Streptomyces sp. ME18-1-4 TaxID=3028685 RepID=UPI0029B4498A|nr:glycoside hydrolase family 15 protein [Streptomyces sp. ME18-1-4]MDX3246774.1 glycoside hydrolase family 15 protein [Streptomyces sp. ME18-1-4]